MKNGSCLIHRWWSVTWAYPFLLHKNLIPWFDWGENRVMHGDITSFVSWMPGLKSGALYRTFCFVNSWVQTGGIPGWRRRVYTACVASDMENTGKPLGWKRRDSALNLVLYVAGLKMVGLSHMTPFNSVPFHSLHASCISVLYAQVWCARTLFVRAADHLSILPSNEQCQNPLGISTVACDNQFNYIVCWKGYAPRTSNQTTGVCETAEVFLRNLIWACLRIGHPKSNHHSPHWNGYFGGWW